MRTTFGMIYDGHNDNIVVNFKLPLVGTVNDIYIYICRTGVKYDL